MPPIYSHLLSSSYGKNLPAAKQKEAIRLSYIFLLRSFIELSSHIKKIDRISKSNKLSQHVRSYFQRCTELLYTPNETSFYTPTGLINKIFFYFEILIQNQELPKDAVKSTKKVFRELKFRIEEEKIDYLTEEEGKQLPKKVARLSVFLKQHLKVLLKTVLELLKNHLDDENIVLNLIKLRKKLAYILEKNRIEEILLNAFPNGIFQIKDFIGQKYKERGFSEIFNSNDKIFEKI